MTLEMTYQDFINRLPPDIAERFQGVGTNPPPVLHAFVVAFIGEIHYLRQKLDEEVRQRTLIIDQVLAMVGSTLFCPKCRSGKVAKSDGKPGFLSFTCGACGNAWVLLDKLPEMRPAEETPT